MKRPMGATLALVARAALLVAWAVSALPLAARAQEDFRSADRGRPVRVEDAVPIKFREWEIELGSRGALAEGARGILGVVELKAGLLRHAQLGIEVESALESISGGGGTESGVEAISGHLLYSVRRETPDGPALAVRLDAATAGFGDLRHEDPQYGVAGILTRSVGRLRVHGNAGYTFATDVDGGDYWRAGLGSDYPVGLFSTALLGDVYAEIPVDTGPTRTWIDVGARFQITNRTVVDVGLSTQLDAWRDGTSNVELILGVSKVFGIGGRTPPYPDPSIR